MAIFDSIRGRLPGGSKKHDRDYNEEYYEDYEHNDVQDVYVNQDDAFGSSREYRYDDHLPLVSMADVRSQGLPALNTTRTAARDAAVHPRSERVSRDYDNSARSSYHATDDYAARTPVSSRPAAGAYGASGSTIGRQAGERVSAVPASSHQPRTAVPRDASASISAKNHENPSYYASRSGAPTARADSAVVREPYQPSYATQAQPTRRTFREVVVVRPVTYGDAEKVANALKQGSVVTIDLRGVHAELAKRILDFSFGAAAALGAHVASLANRVYAITSDYELTDEEHELLVARGIIQ